MRQTAAQLRLITAIDQFKASARGDDQMTDLVASLDDISTKLSGDEHSQESPGQQSVRQGPVRDMAELTQKLKSSVSKPAAPTEGQPDDFKDAAQKAVDVLQTAIAGGPGPESAGTAPPAQGD